ncbi:MAG: hypothetical protein EOM21_21255 [Gammaproteobacteria bacterium]|nr:hypothetical protein [Gammaproteobacteria bacterium]
MADFIVSARSAPETDNFSDLVQRDDLGNLKTTSLIVAERFGKDHDKVLRDIRNLECSQAFRDANFGGSSYISKQGKALPMFLLTRAGFSILAMGFTGRAAVEWKEKFLTAFEQLSAQAHQSIRFALPPDLIEQQRRTDHALAMLANCQRQFHDESMGRFDHIESRLESLEEHAKATSKRRNFGAPVLRQWNGVLLMRYDGKCPCCQTVRIVDQFGRPTDGAYEADHWRSPAHNKVGDGWPVCMNCNRGVLERDRLSKQYAFQHFHDLRKAIYRDGADDLAEQLRLWSFDGVAA